MPNESLSRSRTDRLCDPNTEIYKFEQCVIEADFRRGQEKRLQMRNEVLETQNPVIPWEEQDVPSLQRMIKVGTATDSYGPHDSVVRQGISRLTEQNLAMLQRLYQKDP